LASMVIGVLPSNLAELTQNRTEIDSHSVHIKRNLSDSENHGNQKVIFQGLDWVPPPTGFWLTSLYSSSLQEFSLANEHGPCHFRSL
jgi:hypothetical protein